VPIRFFSLNLHKEIKLIVAHKAYLKVVSWYFDKKTESY